MAVTSSQSHGQGIFRSVIVDDFGAIKILKSLALYVYRLIWFTAFRSDPEVKNLRYVFLTPSATRTQIFYDRRLQKTFKIKVRDIHDLTTAMQVFKFKSYDITTLERFNDIIDIYHSILKDGSRPLILDCGGNIGLASRFFSSEYDHSKVVCIEPDHRNISQAKINNPTGDIDFIESAIASRIGKGTIVNPNAGGNGFQIEKDTDGQIDFVTINSLVTHYESQQCCPFIIKIDIEGFESDLFSDNIEWIEKFPFIMIELHDWMLPGSANSRNFLRAISAHNRDFILAGETIFSIANH